MNIKPLHSNVLIKAIAQDEITKSGIILPGTINKERPEKGEVIAVGPGRLLKDGQRASLMVKVGDKVIFKKYSPDEIKIDEEEFLIINEEDILAILNK